MGEGVNRGFIDKQQVTKEFAQRLQQWSLRPAGSGSPTGLGRTPIAHGHSPNHLAAPRASTPSEVWDARGGSHALEATHFESMNFI